MRFPNSSRPLYSGGGGLPGALRGVRGRLCSPMLALAVCVLAGTNSTRGEPSQGDLLEYTTSTLLLNIASQACGRVEKSDEDRRFYAKQYYAILYVLWFSGKNEDLDTSDMVASKLEEFSRDFGGCSLSELVDRNDPLGLLGMESGDIAEARRMVPAGVYWDWVVSKNQNKDDYRRFVEEFNKQIDSFKQVHSLRPRQSQGDTVSQSWIKNHSTER